MPKLNQIVAIEKGVKAKAQSAVDALYKTLQKPALFEGFSKTYQKKHEEDEGVPPEQKRVEAKADEVIADVVGALIPWLDVTAQKDFANCEALADVAVNGKALIAGAPATFLLFLEKRLTDLHTIVSKVPVLSTAEAWKRDEPRQMFVTEPLITARTKKVQKPIVLYDATEEHPAQTQLITSDEYVGDYLLEKHSGAWTEGRKREVLERIEKLQRATKMAREEANTQAAPERKFASDIFGWIING